MTLDRIKESLNDLTDAQLDALCREVEVIARRRDMTPNDTELDLWEAGGIEEALTLFTPRMHRSGARINPAQALWDAAQTRRAQAMIYTPPSVTDDSIPF